MEFQLSPQIAELKATARAYVERFLLPRERELSRQLKIDPDVRRELEGEARAAGLWLMNVPREFGGLELGLLSSVVVWEEFARTSALPSRGGAVTGPEVSAILYHLNAEQRERFLFPVIRGEKRAAFAQTEPEAGSDPGMMKTTATRDGDEYILRGQKRFIGFVDQSHFLQVLAATDLTKGSRGGITAFLVPVDSPGVRIVRQIETMMRDRPFELAFDDVRVPVANRVGEEGQGFSFGQKWITVGRMRHAARAIGVIERCLELAAKRAQERRTFGAALADRQAIQWMIADMYIHLRQLRLMTYSTAAEYDRGEDVRYDSYICKMKGVEYSFEAADRCMQIYGGLGLTTDFPIETFWREQRSMMITEGPTEVLKQSLARYVIKKYAPT